MSRYVRPAAVAVLASAYRNSDTPLGRAILENRHRDYLPAECAAALAEVRVEAETAIMLLEASRALAGDQVAVRLNLLAELSDEELDELLAAGLLEDLELDTD